MIVCKTTKRLAFDSFIETANRLNAAQPPASRLARGQGCSASLLRKHAAT